ncbi:unnamed protein product [Nezara viridula]|uniref:Uncharacterized protein n=1 Tax=Nezara viridula TaxID=85310 RepID=A0A9P0HNP7_NEZVI|nr:unnamed protein product [Nezara viridula]
MFRGFICCQWYIPLNHWSIAQRLPDVLDALSQSRSTTDQDAEPAGCAEKLVLDLGNASTDRKRQLFCRIVPLQVPIRLHGKKGCCAGQKVLLTHRGTLPLVEDFITF